VTNEAIVVVGVLAIVGFLTAFALVARPSEFRRNAPQLSRPSRRVGDRNVAVPTAQPMSAEKIQPVAPRWPPAMRPSELPERLQSDPVDGTGLL